jgi:hypothetical protein
MAVGQQISISSGPSRSIGDRQAWDTWPAGSRDPAPADDLRSWATHRAELTQTLALRFEAWRESFRDIMVAGPGSGPKRKEIARRPDFGPIRADF